MMPSKKAPSNTSDGDGVECVPETNNEFSSSPLYSKSTNKNVRLGGPGTVLPAFVESFMVWSLALACLGVAFFHYVKQILWVRLRVSNVKDELLELPIATHSRREIHEVPGIVRYQQLVRLLEHPTYWRERTHSKDLGDDENEDDDDDDNIIVARIRSSHLARRLASLVVVHHRKELESQRFDILETLKRNWDMIVQAPQPSKSIDGSHPFQISIVIPAFKENGRGLLHKLQAAQALAHDPLQIEVIVVDAGQCSDLEVVWNCETPLFALLSSARSIGGRGPCLNAGAKIAQGRILTFLHADTRLTQENWDQAILRAFDANATSRITNSCAFSFAIDTSAASPVPPGIRGVEATANWRTHWFHLPYGDQCLSVPRQLFEFVGGFPDQCLMEDYELIRLLRQRVALLKESLVILPQSAHCSPRRWQFYGALFVTWTNSKVVNLYSRGDLTPDELFSLYYRTSKPPARFHSKSPWEVELEELLSGS